MSIKPITLLSPQDVGAGETKTINISIRDIISGILLKWRCTNVTVSAMLAPVAECISKIEVVDGSDVLYSASGAIIQALDYYNNKVFPENRASLTVGGYFEFSCMLNFGRWLGDESFGINPLNYKSLQLRVTFDEDACNTGVTVNSMSIYAMVLEKMTSNIQGLISVKEHFIYTMAASSHTYVDLPTDQIIKKLLIRPYGDTYSPVTLIDTIKLSLDGGSSNQLDIDMEGLYRIIRSQYGTISEAITLDAAVTANTIYSNMSHNVDIKISYQAENFVTAQTHFAVPTVTGRKIALAASVDIKKSTALITGEVPHNVLPILFYDDWTPSSWLDIRQNRSASLDILSSASAAATDKNIIVIESVRQ